MEFRSQRWRVWAKLGGWGAVAAVSGLMLGAPLAAGATPHFVLVSAPYKTSVWVPYWAVYTGGCGSAKVLSRPVWSGTTGIGSFAYTTQSKACHGTVGNIHPSSQGSVNVQFDFALPIHFSKGGGHIVTANWTLAIQTNQSISPAGSCLVPAGSTSIYCAASSGVNVYGYGYLRDLANGSTVPSSTYWGGISNSSYMQSNTYCYNGACYHGYGFSRSWNGGNLNGNTTFQWVMNASGYASINASHSYILAVYFWASGGTGEYNYGSGYATASQNMATNGNGWKLNFLKIV